MTVLETGRLLIRPWSLPEDAADAADIFGDPRVMRFIPVGALDAAGALRLVERMMERARADGFGMWPVVDRATSRIVGESGITYVPGTRDVEIAWLLRADAWGRGYATEAASAILAFALDVLGLQRVYALIDRENGASIRVANRLGMRYDRIVRAYKRDLMRYVVRKRSEAEAQR